MATAGPFHHRTPTPIPQPASTVSSVPSNWPRPLVASPQFVASSVELVEESGNGHASSNGNGDGQQQLMKVKPLQLLDGNLARTAGRPAFLSLSRLMAADDRGIVSAKPGELRASLAFGEAAEPVAALDLVISQSQFGNLSVSFTPHLPGAYEMRLTYGSQELLDPAPTFKVMSEAEAAARRAGPTPALGAGVQ